MSAFEKAAAALNASAKSLKKITDQDRTRLKALARQSTKGDNTTQRPTILQMQQRIQWTAWNQHKGKSKEAAQAEYVKFARDLLTRQGLPANF